MLKFESCSGDGEQRTDVLRAGDFQLRKQRWCGADLFSRHPHVCGVDLLGRTVRRPAKAGHYRLQCSAGFAISAVSSFRLSSHADDNRARVFEAVRCAYSRSKQSHRMCPAQVRGGKAPACALEWRTERRRDIRSPDAKRQPHPGRSATSRNIAALGPDVHGADA